MGFSILLRAFNLIPKWLLISSVAVFIAYMLGISHGRAPYKLAAKLQEVKTKLVTETFTQAETKLIAKGQKANEALKDYECIVGSGVADWLSDIGAD